MGGAGAAETVVPWTAMVAGLVRQELFRDAILVFRQMQLQGVAPNRVTIMTALTACLNLASPPLLRLLHSIAADAQLATDIAIATSLLNIHGKIGSLAAAKEIFHSMEIKSVIAWTAMMAACVHHRENREALVFFRRMLLEHSIANTITFVTVLGACGNCREGASVHKWMIESGISASSVFASTAIVTMYGRCGSVDHAKEVFDSIAEKNFISGTLCAFGKCSSPGNAREIFDAMIERNKVSWTAIIAAYAHSHHGAIAKLFFRRMLRQGEEPDRVTFATILSTCTTAAALVEGKRFHALLAERPAMEMDPVVVSALIHMYSKCGSLESASKVFDRGRSFLLQENLLVWTSVISAYAHHGDGERALKLFARMQQAGLRADGVTILSVLSACAKAGMLETGIQFFASIARDHCLEVTLEHYSCLVDLLGRAGELSAAQELVRRIPDARAYVSFLSSCSVQGDVELGRVAAENVSVLDPSISAGYVVLSNLVSGKLP
ncbi:hypothetical protein SELMODRAFT_112100 [Selaginella moellendorffii]|uniref:Pentacotripeptide-repeat region of PRORP domain-containing protein n=1 Tax=Selaginella moellendorffii TaxID=88036 RepID=D8S9A9_SELML|nr:hypothetical protein SELMODRAFT_112100 [Selaginella moellendorffii]